MTSRPQLDGRVAIVTGGSSGIELATAASLIARGARVTLASRHAERLAEAAASLAPSSQVRTCRTDVRNPEDVRDLIDSTVATAGRLDILVNSAGVGAFAPLNEGTEPL